MEEMRSGRGCVVMKNASPCLGDRSTSTPSAPALAAFAHATLPLQVWQRFGTEISPRPEIAGGNNSTSTPSPPALAALKHAMLPLCQ